MTTHAVVPSWSVKVMLGVRLMNRGEMTYSASPWSFSGGQTVTQATAAADSPLQKQENRQERPGGTDGQGLEDPAVVAVFFGEVGHGDPRLDGALRGTGAGGLALAHTPRSTGSR